MTRTTADAGWWVVALGGVYDPENFDQRETVRTRLRQELLLVAIVPDVYVWVWGENDRCHLVLREFSDRQAADAYAAALSGRGLEVQVRRAMPQDG